ncbi:hypothetical protein GOBAR_AA35545 [Gossypium barbadense]|uniref:Uncharacterized protein n=1 Tax=Gossypium barbadense TaxID=3634 RepID=A0A2P5W254_GOSBA|nr:hypothetical protein GOBAR_AA35545 [Gossypium barbadense]
MSAESSKTHGGLRAVYCSYGCSKYKQGGCDFFEWVEKQDGNGNLNELKGYIKMLLIENRELRIENAEFKKMVKVDEIEKLVRKVAKQKEKLRGYKLLVTKIENDVYFYKVAFITLWIIFVVLKFVV